MTHAAVVVQFRTGVAAAGRSGVVAAQLPQNNMTEEVETLIKYSTSLMSCEQNPSWSLTYTCIRHLNTYTDISWFNLKYYDVCWRILTYAEQKTFYIPKKNWILLTLTVDEFWSSSSEYGCACIVYITPRNAVTLQHQNDFHNKFPQSFSFLPSSSFLGRRKMLFSSLFTHHVLVQFCIFGL